MRDGVEYNRTHPSAWSHWYTNPDESVGFWSDYVTWRDVPTYQRVVFESGLAGIAAELMGSGTARFFHEHVLVKEPGATERTPWHHDQPYYSVDGDQNVSMWIALDPVPAERRCPVPRRLAPLGPMVHPAEVHRPHAVRVRSGRYELLPDIDAMIADDPTDTGSCRSTSSRATSSCSTTGRCTMRPATIGRPAATACVSLRWVGDDARLGRTSVAGVAAVRADGLSPATRSTTHASRTCRWASDRSGDAIVERAEQFGDLVG